MRRSWGWPLGLGAILVAVVGARLLGLHRWVEREPAGSFVVGVPVLLLGLSAIALALGPQRWIESQIEKSRAAKMSFGAAAVSRLSVRANRVMFFVLGAVITVVGAGALFGM